MYGVRQETISPDAPIASRTFGVKVLAEFWVFICAFSFFGGTMELLSGRNVTLAVFILATAVIAGLESIITVIREGQKRQWHDSYFPKLGQHS